MPIARIFRSTAPLALAGVLAVPACAARGRASMSAEASMPAIEFPEPPVLVAVSPGVWVVEDYDAQVFYVSGAYWHLSNGIWYRAATTGSTWVVVTADEVPAAIRDVDEAKYAHYEGRDSADRKLGPPAHAAAPHGGPPGQQDEPGLRTGQDDDVTPPGHDEAHSPPGHSRETPGHGAKNPGHGPK